MTCLPYKDSTIITAQALSILGFFLSLVSFGFIPGLVSFIMLQVVWCCAMNKCGLITAGVFAIITSIADIICGILLLTSTSASQYTVIQSSSSSNDCTYVENGVTYDCSVLTGFSSGSATISTSSGPFVGAAVVSFLAGACWITTAVCIFVFVRSGRYERCVEKSLRGNDDDDIVLPSTTVKPTNTVDVASASNERDETTKVEYVEDLDVESR